MGCNSSKNKIHVVAHGTMVDNTRTTSGKIKTVTPSSKKNNSRTESATSKKSKASSGSQESLDDRDGSDSRGGSATSKASKHSGDSGFDDEAYAKVITEMSDPHRVQEIENEFKTPRELDFGIVGQQCSQRHSAKDKDRLEEQRVLASLQSEGLITKPISRATYGLSFDIVAAHGVEDMFGVAKKPPARLAKLEKRRKKKKLTEEDIQQKLEKAEKRRKELEQQRLDKIQSVTMKSDVQNALDSFANRQKNIDTDIKSKEEQALENREKKLLEMKAKLQKKKEHAEMVRRRKMAAIADGDDEREDEPVIRQSLITEDTPVGPGVSTSQDY